MSLNHGQQQAVDAPGHCMIVACPGSGKTYTLVQRARRLLSESPTRRLAIVTFTRAAAEELKERLVKALGPDVMPRIEAGTFHSLCMKQLPALYGKFGGRGFTIANEGATHAMMFNAWQATTKRFPAARLNLQTVKQTIEFAKANEGLLPTSPHQEAMTFAIAQYQSLLQAQKMMDFADIINFTVMGMQSGQIPPLAVQDLLVDEFQDADAAQIAWVLAHVAHGIRVTCVGDDDQSIYGFRSGKGYAGMMQFAKASGAITVTLDTTYRCAAPVIAHAARLIAHNKERVPKAIKTANTQSGSVDRRDFEVFDFEVAAACEELVSRGKGETAAILGRTTSVLRAVDAQLRDMGVTYKGGLGGDFWKGGLPGVVHGLIGAIAGKKPQGIITALSARGLNSDAVSAAREHVLAANGRIDALLASGAWLDGLRDEQVVLWNQIRPEFVRLLEVANGPRAVFATTCTDFLQADKGEFTTKKVVEVVHKAIGEMPGSLGDVYQRLERLLREKPDDDPNATLSILTLHASKGLEFDRVWMPAMRQGMLPHGNSEVDEERRLAYVGMTRARRFLTLSYAGTYGKGSFAPESVFLLESGLPSPDAVRRRTSAG